MTRPKLGVVADDLTGATDTSVQFARRGWAAILLLERGLTPVQVRGSDPKWVKAAISGRKAPDVDVWGSDPRTGSAGLQPGPADAPADSAAVAVTTDSRALGVLDAENRTAAAVDMLVASGIERLYVKIDSTMRGSIPGQISGALKAWRAKYPDAVAIVCAAYPRMRRTVVNNHLLVGGDPVEQSAAGNDPVTPVNTSDLAVLIPGSRHVAIDELATRRGADVLTIDAQSNEDLHELALAIDRIGPRAIPVGSAGLADALAEVWGGSPAKDIMPGFARTAPRHILVQVTSMNPVSRNQVARLHEVFPEIELLSGRAEDVSIDVAQRVETGGCQLLGLIGGDGARAALGRLNASAIRIVGAHVEGIPMGTIVSGRADGTPVFTKAGGFGDEDALVKLVEALTS